MEKLLKSGCLAALLLIAVASSGCRHLENPGKVYPQSPTVEDTRSGTITRHLPDDIPIPRDMTYVTRLNQSFGYFEGGVRVGRFHLWGYVPTDEVATFYREQMPKRPYGWTFVSEQPHGATNVMHFRKDSESVAISIGPEESATIAEISLNTEARKP